MMLLRIRYLIESANLCKITELQSTSFASRGHQTGRTDSVVLGPLILVLASDIRPQHARISLLL